MLVHLECTAADAAAPTTGAHPPTCVPGVLLDPHELQAQLPILHPPAIQRHGGRHRQHQLRQHAQGQGQAGAVLRPPRSTPVPVLGWVGDCGLRKGNAGRADPRQQAAPPHTLTGLGFMPMLSTGPRSWSCSSISSTSLALCGRTKLPPRSVCSTLTCRGEVGGAAAAAAGGSGLSRAARQPMCVIGRRSGMRPRTARFAREPPTATLAASGRTLAISFIAAGPRPPELMGQWL